MWGILADFLIFYCPLSQLFDITKGSVRPEKTILDFWLALLDSGRAFFIHNEKWKIMFRWDYDSRLQKCKLRFHWASCTVIKGRGLLFQTHLPNMHTALLHHLCLWGASLVGLLSLLPSLWSCSFPNRGYWKLSPSLDWKLPHLSKFPLPALELDVQYLTVKEGIK